MLLNLPTGLLAQFNDPDPEFACKEVSPDASVPCETTLCSRYGEGRYGITLGVEITSSADLVAAEGTSTFTNRDIILAGPFIVDGSLSFVNCRIKATSPDAALYVTDGAILLLDETKLFACNKMWQGIVVFQGTAGNGQLRFLNNTEIEDAVRVIEFLRYTTAPPSVTITNTTFNRNYVDIYADFRQIPGGGTATVPAALDLSRFRNNLLVCTCDLLPGAPGDALRTWAGMQLHLATTVVGLSTDGFSGRFDNITVGMRLDGGTMNVRGGCDFQNMIDNKQPSPQDAHGWGIVAYKGCKLTIGVSQTSTFFSNGGQTVFGGGGIYGSSAALSVQNCVFDDNNNGIVSRDNEANENIIIKNNQIDLQAGNFSAIYVERSSLGGTTQKVLIDKNTVRRLGATSLPPKFISGLPNNLFAIALYGKSVSSSNLAWITNNTYEDYTSYNPDWDTNGGTDNGIVVSSTAPTSPALGNNIKVSNNHVHYLATVAADGFNINKVGIVVAFLPGSTGIEVKNNLVESDQAPRQSPPLLNWGLVFNNTQRANVCSNTFDNLYYGMEFNFNNSPTELVTNSVNGYGGIGWAVNAGGLGTQLRRDNTWSGPTWTGGLAAAASNTIVAGFTPYFVSSTTNPAINPSNVSPSGWFSPGMTGTPSTFCGPVTDGGGGGGGVRIEEMEQRFLTNGRDTSFGMSFAEAWEQSILLLGKLQRHPSLKSTSIPATQYDTASINQPAKRFATVYRMLETTNQAVDSVYGGVLDSLDMVLDSLLVEIDNADSLLATGTLSSGAAATLLAQRHTWAGQAGTVWAGHATLAAQSLTDRKTGWQAALTYNNATTTSILVEANHKTMLRLLLSLAVNDTLTSTEQSDLAALAAQSPTTGGSAVSTARRFLFSSECEEYAERLLRPSTSQVRTVSTGALKVYPNPVSDLLNVELPAAARWSVLNLQGQVVTTGQSAGGGLLPVPVGSLRNGVYALALTYADGRTETTRFVVLH